MNQLPNNNAIPINDWVLKNKTPSCMWSLLSTSVGSWVEWIRTAVQRDPCKEWVSPVSSLLFNQRFFYLPCFLGVDWKEREEEYIGSALFLMPLSAEPGNRNRKHSREEFLLGSCVETPWDKTSKNTNKKHTRNKQEEEGKDVEKRGVSCLITFPFFCPFVL